MSAVLVETLVWTGALLALVLLVRRPIARQFGARAAYALWALPMARLLLPPLVLPAWMAPLPEAASDAGAGIASDLVLADSAQAVVVDGTQAVAPASLAPAAGPLDTLAALDWEAVLLTLWLAGAALFLVRRYALYFRMRRALLEGARPMGEVGRIRLVETPGADGPVAFGVVDKVIALPLGFMAGRDRAARDLALAHEIAHHRGHDLLCNMVVQPLFALHWFNPLSALGWRALRRDQEAACDARVMAHCPRESRAAYAAVIARFATQPRQASRLALAAPMACPVLGDRSVVERLRSLAMTDISARRRWSGRVLLALAALAVPLTGSISYAQDETATDAVEPPLPPALPEAPVPPAAPAAPSAPEAPQAGLDGESENRVVRIERRVTGPDGEHIRVERRVVHRDGEAMSAEDRAELARDMAELRRELDKELGENSEVRRELRRELGENGEVQRQVRLAIADASRARSHALAQAQAAIAAAPRVVMQCRQGQREVAETVESTDGRQQIFICNARATAEAHRAISEARAEISRTRELTSSQRNEALRSLDEAERAVRAD